MSASQRVCMMLGVFFAVVSVAPLGAQGGDTVEALGLVLQTLPDEDLADIQAAVGHRVGVMVTQVKPGPGQTAGIKAKDIVMVIGSTGVASAAEAAKALQALTGPTQIMGMTFANDDYAPHQWNLTPGGAGQPAAGPIPAGPAIATGAGGVGWTLEALDAASLDRIEKAAGRRVGVAVAQVAAGSPAAKAQVKPMDILLVVAGQGVASPAAVEQALQGRTGVINLLAMRPGQNQYETVNLQLDLGGAGAGQAGGQPVAGGEQPDPVNAYFDLMDFVRTQAWSRPVSTPVAERHRVGEVLRVSWDQLGAEGQAQIFQLPQVWQALREQWAKASKADRDKLVATWRVVLLTPHQFYPPPGNLQQYRSDGGEVSFEYPGDWTGAVQEIQGIPMVYLGPPGTQTSWEKVLEGATSPPGILLALVEKDAQMNALPSFAAGARLLAQLHFKNAMGNFREIDVIDLQEQGAIITYQGKFPGQQQEQFYWIGAVPFGSKAIVAGRMGGPMAQAEVLLPVMRHLLVSMKLNPPAPPGGGGVVGAWETAWSRVDVAITKNIWAPSGN